MKIILTGATGYVGEGTLLELLKVDTVEKVLSVSRKPTGITHEKLEEYLVPDFMELKAGDDHFKDYDAVFFIAGITSVGTPKDTYVRISQEIPLHFADIMPDKERMTFIYLSGAGTSPDGKQFWQQVKSKRFSRRASNAPSVFVLQSCDGLRGRSISRRCSISFFRSIPYSV